MLFGERIRELRQAKDLSLREFAARLGKITAPYLSDIELGRRYPSDEVMARMAKVLGVSLDELRKLDPRAPVEELKQSITDDPQLAFALRQVVSKGVSGEELLRALNGLKKDKGTR